MKLVKNLQYFAMVEKADIPSEDLGFPKEDSNISKPTQPDDKNQETQNPNESPTPDHENQGNQKPTESQKPNDTTNTPPEPEATNQGTDPFLGILICLGVLLGLVLIYLIYKGIKAIRKWLKK